MKLIHSLHKKIYFIKLMKNFWGGLAPPGPPLDPPLTVNASLSIGIKDLHELDLRLKESGFSYAQWNGLGLALGIIQTKLDAIKSNNPYNVEGCLIDCLSLWLQQNYDTEKYSKPTMEVLAAALKEIGLRAVASEIIGESSQDSTHAHTCT